MGPKNPTLKDVLSADVAEALKVDKKYHNRGLSHWLHLQIRNMPMGEFRAEDVLHSLPIKERYPMCSRLEISSALSYLAGLDPPPIVRIGSPRSGNYRLAGASPAAVLEDRAIIENVLKALSDFEQLVRKYDSIISHTSELKRALGKV